MSTKILAIETSCDETALAIVECDRAVPLSSSAQAEDPETLDSPAKQGNDNVFFKILAEAVASQIKIHRPFGGVVPALAKREHIKNLPILFNKVFLHHLEPLRHPERNEGSREYVDKILRRSAPQNDKGGIDLIAVTVGPGLEPALWTGINFANDLGEKLKIPVVGINHLEGHIFSNWIPVRKEIRNSKFEIRNSTKTIAFPAIVLVVSGGHTILLKMTGIKKWSKLGETRDDAVGEAFDKVAKMLGLPYPGGPEIEKLAAQGNPVAIPFPRPMLNSKNYDFSFSGLKTAVLYYLKDTNKIPRKSASGPRESAEAARIAASFQQAAIDVLVRKTIRAAAEFDARSVLLCGGVAANKALQKAFEDEILRLRSASRSSAQDDWRIFVPPVKFNTDNAVMIAAAACLGNHYPTDRALPNLNL